MAAVTIRIIIKKILIALILLLFMKLSPVRLQRYLRCTTNPTNIAHVHKMSLEMFSFHMIAHIIFTFMRKLMTVTAVQSRIGFILGDILV